MIRDIERMLERMETILEQDFIHQDQEALRKLHKDVSDKLNDLEFDIDRAIFQRLQRRLANSAAKFDTHADVNDQMWQLMHHKDGKKS